MSNYNLWLFRKNYNNLLITNSLHTIVIAYARYARKNGNNEATMLKLGKQRIFSKIFS